MGEKSLSTTACIPRDLTLPWLAAKIFSLLNHSFISKTRGTYMKPGFAMVATLILRGILLTVLAAMGLASAQRAAKPVGADDLLPSSPQVIHPEELAQALKASGAHKPFVLYVGPKAFFAQAHIPGAEFIGPMGKPEGMGKLRARAASLPKDGAVVIYCGCCPWDHCPNIRPAFAELKKAGFTKVRVLYLATSFGADWKDKGFPVASGD
jgi:thiosulfate/3-mercaptopyruvate sulfurtransferase